MVLSRNRNRGAGIAVKYVLGATVSALALCQGGLSYAQEAGSGPQAGSREVVIVSAQKREETVIEVPMSITVLGGDELDAQGIDTIQDLSFAVPGLTMREDGPGSYTIFLRGLANQSGSGALVSVYMDEVPLTLGGFTQLSPDALDIERVEVLKGPQGTLYGQGAAGGTIRYITADPNLNTLEGRVGAELYSVTDGEVGARGEAVLSVPLIDNELAARFALAVTDGGGWLDQTEAGIEDGNGTELTNFRGKLLWAPTEAFEARFMAQIHRASTELGMGYSDPGRVIAVGPDRSKVMIPKEFDFDIYNLELRYDFGFAELVSATTNITHDHQYPFTYIPREGNYSFGIVEGNDDRFETAERFSQELRLVSAEGPFEWTVGAFYANGHGELLADYEYAYAPAGDLYTGGGVLYDDLFYFRRSTSTSYSIFADASYAFTDRFRVGAGASYFEDSQTSRIEYAPGTGNVLEAEFDSVNPRVYASYEFMDEANLYASVAKGFRSGGFNSAPFDPYDPESVYTYEVGMKGIVAGGDFQYDVAVFYSDYQDMIRRRLVNVGGQFLGESSNIGEVEIKGLEAGASYQITDAFSVTATAAFLDSEVVATDATDQVNNVGDRTDYTPEVSFTLGAAYEFMIGSMPAFARADYNYRDEVTYIDRSSFLEAVLPQASDEISLLNLRAGAEIGQGLNVEIFATNVTDEDKSIDPYQGWANANRTRPRTVGIGITKDF